MNFFSLCYERVSVMLTTNLPFSEWPQVFGDESLAGALIDRLTHHVHVGWRSRASPIVCGPA